METRPLIDSTPTQAQRLSILRPPIASRTLLVGTTGSGKSVLGKAMLEWLNLQHIVIIDPKAEFRFTSARISRTPTELASPWNQSRIRQYQPKRELLNDSDAWEQVFEWVFARKNTVLYIDELPAVCKGATSYPPSLAAIYQQGRSRKITVIACAQRATGFPIPCISESGRICLFEVGADSDRERMADNCAKALKKPVLENPGADAHCFYYWERRAGSLPFIAKYNM